MADEKKKEAEAPKEPEAQVEQKATGPAKAPESLRLVMGEKVAMTQIFTDDGQCKPVTAVKTGFCRVVCVKTKDSKDGYNAVQLGYGERKEKHLNAPLAGMYKASKQAPARVLREFRLPSTEGFEAGQIVSLEGRFSEGDYVDVQGTSKGKGFAGVMKRHNFGGMPAGHGASDKERSPGSLASRRSLGRVIPGQRMAGHMGHVTHTTQKVEVVEVDVEKGIIYLKGSVPGPNGSMVVIKETVKHQKRVPEKVTAKGPKKDKMGNIIQESGSKGKKK
jgi:large subunit ribosomal protein L3